MRFQSFKLLYRDIEHHDSTSRFINAMRPFILGLTAFSIFVLFEEKNTMEGKHESFPTTRFYKWGKKGVTQFKYRLMDLVEIQKQ